MKKLLFLFLLFPIFSFAQEKKEVSFSLSAPSCNYIINGSDKDFYVFNFENQSQSELYNLALVAITKTFVSAKDVVSKVENKMISVNSAFKVQYTVGGLISVNNTVNFTFEMEFKDGRIRINAPQIISIADKRGSTSAPIRDHIVSGSDYTKLSTYAYKYLQVNDIINTVLSYMSESKTEEDW